MTRKPDIKPEDRVLDWCSGHDPRSREYSFYSLDRQLSEPKPRFWNIGQVLDQGREGACVGFGWTAELLASPYPFHTLYNTAQSFAQSLYNRARAFDRAKGYVWPEGASVTSGAQAVLERGHIKSYRWAFSVTELRDAVINHGPVVVGIPWMEGMYETRPSGLVQVHGKQVGGHCLTITGYHPAMRIAGEGWKARHEVFRWVNSWGTGYGQKGTGLIRIEDLDNLLSRRGEACVPMHRQKIVRL